MKEDRLQIRIDAELKTWFKEYSDRAGKDMSQLVEAYIRQLKRQEKDRLVRP